MDSFVCFGQSVFLLLISRTTRTIIILCLLDIHFYFLWIYFIGIVICGKSAISKCARENFLWFFRSFLYYYFFSAIFFLCKSVMCITWQLTMWVWTFLSLRFIFHFLIGETKYKARMENSKLFSFIVKYSDMNEKPHLVYLNICCLLDMCNVYRSCTICALCMRVFFIRLFSFSFSLSIYSVSKTKLDGFVIIYIYNRDTLCILWPKGALRISWSYIINICEHLSYNLLFCDIFWDPAYYNQLSVCTVHCSL